VDAVTEYAIAYALTTSAGIRGILTLALASLALHFGWLHSLPGFTWLGTTPVTIALFVVAGFDFLGDKVPAVDHVLHALQIVVKPVCAAILVGGIFHGQSNATIATLMTLGAINALGIHIASAGLRGVSTATTAGTANPFVSTAEDWGTLLLTGLAILAPFLAVAMALLVSVGAGYLLFIMWKHLRSRSAQSSQ
jgi:hypothetical protein